MCAAWEGNWDLSVLVGLLCDDAAARNRVLADGTSGLAFAWKR